MSRCCLNGAGLAVAAAIVLVGCAAPTVVEDHLESNGSIADDFALGDREIVLSVRFDRKLEADDTFMVEWLFPDGSVYLRKPVRRSADSDDRIETGIPVRGKAPGRNPGTWHVQLWQDDRRVVSQSFEIRGEPRTPDADAVEFASLAYCGPSRWNDAAISARRSAGVVAGRPGAWIGGDVLQAAGATYSSVILLTGCAPG